MRKFLFLLFAIAAQTTLLSQEQEYYPEGTKWTEIRLDTMKYDSWYSKVGDEWVQNIEAECVLAGSHVTNQKPTGDLIMDGGT